MLTSTSSSTAHRRAAVPRHTKWGTKYCCVDWLKYAPRSPFPYKYISNGITEIVLKARGGTSYCLVFETMAFKCQIIERHKSWLRLELTRLAIKYPFHAHNCWLFEWVNQLTRYSIYSTTGQTAATEILFIDKFDVAHWDCYFRTIH